MAIKTKKLRLPRVQSVTLRNFSLFTLANEITVPVGNGIFCLAGANGLGKSTFLLAVTYGITGIVPDRDFSSVDAYYRDSIEFSSKFFAGRINERDREAAEISLSLRVGESSFDLTRGMFEPDTLRELTICSAVGTPEERRKDYASRSPGDRHRAYEEAITKAVGLNTFQQLVFLQHFVLTFDERRHLLFWDHRALEQTLYLAFGIDSAQAYQADVLRQKMQKAESHARNDNWQATQLRKKIRDLQAESSGGDDSSAEELQEEYDRLEGSVTRCKRRAEQVEARLRDASLRLAELSASQATLRNEYATAFADRLEGVADIDKHPIVVSSKREGRCNLCGCSNSGIGAAIDEQIKADSCPLCGASLKGPTGRKNLKRLRQLDKDLASVGDDLTEVLLKRDRLIQESDQANYKVGVAEAAFGEFADANEQAILRAKASASDGIRELIAEYTRRMNDFLGRKKKRYKDRDKARKELEALRKELQERYAAVEEEFVPQFKTLATSFLGIDLDIRLDTAASVGITLVLDIRGTTRRDHHQLSESQRFFIDIALRMAIAQFIADKKSPPLLYIDTPEGSLDVAYETKAGRMFAQFAKQDGGIMMAANINGSRLLTAMAEACGKRFMRVQRMTNWTELSEVQQEEEHLFKKVLGDIEKSLKKGGGRG